MTPRENALLLYSTILQKAQAEGRLIPVMAEMGRRDLFFLGLFILGIDKLNHDWLFDRCREVQASPNGHLDLWAREHFKSTIITYMQTIQTIVNDPEVTVGIFSFNRSIATDFLKQIKSACENNTLLKACYPDVLYENPAKESPNWTIYNGITVKRKSIVKEATVEAWGMIDALPTGRHFKLRIYDDVITERFVRNPEMVQKVLEQWALSLNLGSEGGLGVEGGGAARYIGTRYAFADVYNVIMEREAASPRIYPATVDGTPEGDPVLLSREALAIKFKSMGPHVFGCQMLQNPRADITMGFKEDWLRLQPVESYGGRIPHYGMNCYMLVDPAGSKKKGSDYTVIVVIGLSQDGNYYLIDAVRDRLNLNERTKTIMNLHKIYRPLAVGYERYGMQSDIEHIKYVQDNENYHFNITELGGQVAKVDRIRRLVPIFSRGGFYLPVNLYFMDYEGHQRDFTREFIDEEYLAFPVAAHDDMLDCISRIVEKDLNASFPTTNIVSYGSAPLRAKDNFYETYAS